MSDALKDKNEFRYYRQDVRFGKVTESGFPKEMDKIFEQINTPDFDFKILFQSDIEAKKARLDSDKNFYKFQKEDIQRTNSTKPQTLGLDDADRESLKEIE